MLLLFELAISCILRAFIKEANSTIKKRYADLHRILLKSSPKRYTDSVFPIASHRHGQLKRFHFIHEQIIRPTVASNRILDPDGLSAKSAIPGSGCPEFLGPDDSIPLHPIPVLKIANLLPVGA